MVEKKQLVGIGILGIETVLYDRVRSGEISDEAAHFTGGVALGLITNNPVVLFGAILGWEIMEPYIAVIRGETKYVPSYGTILLKDTMKDIMITSIGAYIGSKV